MKPTSVCSICGHWYSDSATYAALNQIAVYAYVREEAAIDRVITERTSAAIEELVEARLLLRQAERQVNEFPRALRYAPHVCAQAA